MDPANQTTDEEKVMMWITEIKLNTNRFLEEFSPYREDQLIFKPSQDTWSIAENIQHLIEFNQSYFPIFSQLLAQTYKPSWTSRFRFINNLLGNLLLKSVSDDRKKKIKTLPLWAPKKLPSAKDLLSTFESHQFELIDWILKLKPYIGQATVINSPANKLISYRLDVAIELIIMHEKRHLNQAKEVIESYK